MCNIVQLLNEEISEDKHKSKPMWYNDRNIKV